MTRNLVYFNMAIQKAAEDYLEAMLMMKEKHGYIRSIDVAEKLNVTKPSVSYATKRLKESGHITMDKDGLIADGNRHGGSRGDAQATQGAHEVPHHARRR